MNDDIDKDGTVITFKRPRKVIGHIAPIKAKDVRFGPTGPKIIEQEETPALQKRPEIQYLELRESFLERLAELIESNAVFNTHRIPANIIARHMAESAHLFNASLFLHNTAVTRKEKENEQPK